MTIQIVSEKEVMGQSETLGLHWVSRTVVVIAHVTCMSESPLSAIVP